METVLPLEGVFRYLVQERGFLLTLRDLEDALNALRLGFGGSDRRSLQKLLERLWARSEDEVRKLELLFREIPFPNVEEIAAWTEDQSSPLGESAIGEGAGEAEVADEDVLAPMQMDFAPPGLSGLGLPTARVPESRREPFILHPIPPLSLRSLIIVWRRFRLPLRVGPSLELDLEATLAEQCRQGLLTELVLVPARRNLARLVVLVDSSPSMAAFHAFFPLLEESLEEGRLGLAALYYFHDTPDDRLYRRPSLIDPVLLDDVMEEQGASAVMVVSDAGAARGLRDRDRVAATAKFLMRIAGRWGPVAWVNPMPIGRWPGTSAGSIARLPGLTMNEMTEDGLVRAIDILRGFRSA